MNHNIRRLARYLLVAILAGIAASVAEAVASDAAMELDKVVRRSVVDFGYSDQTADAFLAMVRTWHCPQMQQTLERAAQEFKQGAISVSQYADIETATAERLAITIRIAVPSTDLSVERGDECYDLAYVAQKRQTHCLGYTQMFFIFGNAIGLKVRGIQVEEHLVGRMPINAAHVACLVERHDGKDLQIDLTVPKVVSEGFAFEEQYAREGESWRIKNIENRLQLHPKIVLLDRDGLDAMIFTMRGNVLHDSKKLVESLSAYDRAIQLNPRCGVAYWNRALCHVETNQVAEAMADYNKAIELMPRHPAVYAGRGGFSMNMGHLSEAIADFSKAIALDPQMAEAYANRAMAYGITNRFDEAMADFNQAITIQPQSAALYLNRGSLYGMMGKPTEAIADCTMAIQHDPTCAHAFFTRATAYADLSKTNEAVADFSKAIEIDPKQASFYFNRGLANLNAGRFQVTIPDFTRAIELQADFAKAYALRGAAKARLGNTEDAKKDFQKAIELNPDQVEDIKDMASGNGVKL